MIRRLLAPAAVVLALTAACGGSSSGGASTAATTPAASSTAPANVDATKAEITANWEKFFDYNTPQTEAEKYIQGGAALEPALTFAQQEQKQTKTKQSAKVTSITFTSPTTASLKYQLLNGTAVLLPDADGKAVLENGTWKVSKETFCGLVQLGAGGKAVPSC